MNTEIQRPKVGLGVLVFKGNTFLMQQRTGAHGASTWSLPGGHLEWFESFEETACRETLEEVGVSLKNVRFITATNDIFEAEDKHYVTIFMSADWEAGEPQIMEPDKCLELRWVEWGKPLPEPLFIPFANFIKSGIDPRNC